MIKTKNPDLTEEDLEWVKETDDLAQKLKLLITPHIMRKTPEISYNAVCHILVGLGITLGMEAKQQVIVIGHHLAEVYNAFERLKKENPRFKEMVLKRKSRKS